MQNKFSVLGKEIEKSAELQSKVSRKKQPVQKKDDQNIQMPLEEISKEQHVPSKEILKQKGVSNLPHPMDRHSGTGRGKELRKNGVGRHNWGTYKDDMKSYEVFIMSEGEENQEELSNEEIQQVSEQSDIITKRRIRKQKKKNQSTVKASSLDKNYQQGIQFNENDFPPLVS